MLVLKIWKWRLEKGNKTFSVDSDRIYIRYSFVVYFLLGLLCLKIASLGTSPAVQWLRLHASNTGGTGPCWRTKILHVAGMLNLCPTLCNPMDCSPPGSFIPGIFQAKILEWVATSYSRGSSRTRDQTHVSYISCMGRQVLYHSCHLGSPMCQIYIYGSPFKRSDKGIPLIFSYVFSFHV